MQVKAFIYWKNEINAEVRRLQIKENMQIKFTYLAARLQEIYPILRIKDYTVSWKDEDGDNITISSDEEMEIALSSMTHNVMKLNVYCSATKPLYGSGVAMTGTRDNATVLEPNGQEHSKLLQRSVSSSKDDKLDMTKNKPIIQEKQLQPDNHIKSEPNMPKVRTPKQKPANSENNNLITNTSKGQPKIQQKQLQPDSDKIEVDKAVKKMLSMGFTDNDGWITQLLAETTSGDIASVIEFLTPVTNTDKTE